MHKERAQLVLSQTPIRIKRYRRYWSVFPSQLEYITDEDLLDVSPAASKLIHLALSIAWIRDDNLNLYHKDFDDD